jgi:hypothetical protein
VPPWHELIEFYAKKVSGEPFTSHILKTYPGLDIKKLRKIQRQFWTAFKHATHQHGGKERDDDKLLTRFKDEQNDHVLFIGWYDYAIATGKNAGRSPSAPSVVYRFAPDETKRPPFN